MIKAIAIDDEPLALAIIETFCSRVDTLELVQVFTDTSKALAYLSEHQINLLFLDISMPGISGLELYKEIPESTMVIFTTSYSEYAIEGFNLSAIDYLLKPFEYERFVKAIEKAREYWEFVQQKESETKQFLFVKVDYSMMKVVVADILYIEGLDNYLKIYFDNAKPILVRMSMKVIMERLPGKDFIRVHRSYIVPLNKVKAMRNKMLFIGTIEIPIGTNYVQSVSELFKVS